LPAPASSDPSGTLPTTSDSLVPPATFADGTRAVSLDRVSVQAPGLRLLLREIQLSVGVGEHWAVLGRNGSGKTTLLNVIGGVTEPTSGAVRVMGERLGAPGFRDPRLRIGVVHAAPARFASTLTAAEVVLLRASAPPALRGARINPDEVRRARELLRLLGCEHLADRKYGVCSQGERQRISLARALLRGPALLLLDEPAAGLDLPGRGAFLDAMQRLAAARPELTSITVSHHLEELPASTTHAALLRGGSLMLAGRVDQVMNDRALSECFGVPVAVRADDYGWSAAFTRARW
jgi:iron complex transport system ATP-binding protein